MTSQARMPCHANDSGTHPQGIMFSYTRGIAEPSCIENYSNTFDWVVLRGVPDLSGGIPPQEYAQSTVSNRHVDPTCLDATPRCCDVIYVSAPMVLPGSGSVRLERNMTVEDRLLYEGSSSVNQYCFRPDDAGKWMLSSDTDCQYRHQTYGLVASTHFSNACPNNITNDVLPSLAWMYYNHTHSRWALDSNGEITVSCDAPSTSTARTAEATAAPTFSRDTVRSIFACNFSQLTGNNTVSCSVFSGRWQVGANATPTSLTGPNRGAPPSEDSYAYIEASGACTEPSHLMTTPAFSLPTGGTLFFYYHMYGVNTGTLTVSGTTMHSPNVNGDGWVLLDEISGQLSNDANDWHRVAVFLPSSTSAVRFSATIQGSRSDIAIDDINITDQVTLEVTWPPTVNGGAPPLHPTAPPTTVYPGPPPSISLPTAVLIIPPTNQPSSQPPFPPRPTPLEPPTAQASRAPSSTEQVTTASDDDSTDGGQDSGSGGRVLIAVVIALLFLFGVLLTAVLLKRRRRPRQAKVLSSTINPVFANGPQVENDNSHAAGSRKENSTHAGTCTLSDDSDAVLMASAESRSSNAYGCTVLAGNAEHAPANGNRTDKGSQPCTYNIFQDPAQSPAAYNVFQDLPPAASYSVFQDTVPGSPNYTLFCSPGAGVAIVPGSDGNIYHVPLEADTPDVGAAYATPASGPPAVYATSRSANTDQYVLNQTPA